MSTDIDDLRSALDALDECSSCEGSLRVEGPVSLSLPGEAPVAVTDPSLVDWLVARGEPAPFGLDDRTLVDREVRDAFRLRARGATRVYGFDPQSILHEIEGALSPREHLAATLTDVLVYLPGGHFLRHKDTPTSLDLIGTLVVGLPVAHTGGAFEISDGDETCEVDWSGTPDPHLVRWVALSGDVDHTILPIQTGARVTLVYALVRTGKDREDPGWQRRFAAVDACARRLRCADGPVMILCTRHAVGTKDFSELGLDALRGADRELAEVLVSAGLRVRVRTCLAASDCEDGHAPLPPRLRAGGWREVSFARLARPLGEGDLPAGTECVTFVPPCGDGGGFFEDEVLYLGPYLDEPIPEERWLVRRTAAATLLSALEFAGDGYVGNAASDAYLYRLAALEVSRPPSASS